ncbi:MAG: sugar ABC transporter substrate-binding protein [Micromonosporaceae bacterium]
MRTKAWIGVALSALLVPLAAGCGGETQDGGGKVRMWMYPIFADTKLNQTFWAEHEKAFEREHRGIDLVVERQPWDKSNEKVAAALASGKAPDLILFRPDQIPQYADMKAIVPVDDVVADVKDDLIPSAVDAVTMGGSMYGAPIYHTVTTQVCNKKLLDAGGVSKAPANWDDVRDVASRLARKKITAFDYPAKSEAGLNLSFYPLLWQAGGSVFSKDGSKTAFNSPEGLKALELVVDLWKQRAIPRSALTSSHDPVNGPVGKGKVACSFITTAAEAEQLGELWGSENLVVTPPLKDAEQAAFGIPGAMVLTRNSKSPEAAKKVMSYLMDEKVMAELNTKSGFFPPRSSVKLTSDSPVLKTFAEQLPLMRPGELHPKAPQVATILSVQIQAALKGDKTPEQALKAAAKEADALVARGG